MPAAKYFVTSEPGTYIAGVGFVKPGELYVAPPKHVPSRTVLPANEEAVAELKKLKAALEARAGEVIKDAAEFGEESDKKSAALRAKNFRDQAKAIVLEVSRPVVEEPAIQPGLTLEELQGAKAGDPSQAPGEKQQHRKL
jgi:hypothetical protein